MNTAVPRTTSGICGENNNMTDIVITGASGFIGGHLCRLLEKKEGWNLHPYGRRACATLPLRCYHRVQSYQEIEVPAGAILIHLAEENNIRRMAQHLEWYMDQTQSLARFLLSQPISRAIYFSSAAVYGDRSPEERSEEDPLDLTNAYAQLKFGVERLFLEAGHTVVRPSNVYGKGMSEQNVFSEILKQLNMECPVRVHSLESMRDFIQVADLVRGIQTLVERPVPGVFNFGTGNRTTTRDLVHLFLSLTHQPDRKVQARDTERRFSCNVLDYSKARKILDWKPLINLKNGVKEFVT